MRLDRDRGGDRLTRDDHLYDFIVEIDHNTLAAHRRPRQRGVPASGAAEFCTDRGLRFDDQSAMLRLLARLGPETKIVIG